MSDARDQLLLSCRHIIFTTASYWGETDFSNAGELGADRLIIQPIEPQKLLSEIEFLMHSKRREN